ncbi:MAG: helix-turn-helix domain-containing protein [Kofleriaceae bacterium]
MTLDEATKVLRISIGTMYRWINSGRVPVHRVGHRLLVPRQSLRDLLTTSIVDASTLNASSSRARSRSR